MRPAMKLLALLEEKGALSASDAGGLLGFSRSHMSRQARNLVTRGWVRELEDPDDKRLVLFDLTRAGKTALTNGGARRVRKPAQAEARTDD